MWVLDFGFVYFGCFLLGRFGLYCVVLVLVSGIQGDCGEGGRFGATWKII